MHAEPYQRDDGRWEVRWQATNGQVVATTHSQGYEDRRDAEHAIDLMVRWVQEGGEVLWPNGTRDWVATTPRPS